MLESHHATQGKSADYPDPAEYQGCLEAREQLPRDEPRCHDPLCQARNACRRWLERDGHADRHYSIMRPKYHCNDTPCSHHLPADAP